MRLMNLTEAFRPASVILYLSNIYSHRTLCNFSTYKLNAIWMSANLIPIFTPFSGR